MRLDENWLLNRTERAVRMRKETPEFGWGEMRVLKTDNKAVLAHTCTWRGNTVAAGHNFSRATCSVTIEWPAGTEDYRWLRVHGTA
jgi:maltose alpha-D-glucosyltransferase/alpha-amylase